MVLRVASSVDVVKEAAEGSRLIFYIVCVVTNTRPQQLLITKVKQFVGSSAFTRRSQWTVEQLRQVNGINPNKVSRLFISLDS